MGGNKSNDDTVISMGGVFDFSGKEQMFSLSYRY